MNKTNGILILILTAFLSGNMNRVSAIENTGNSYEISGQTCGISDNRLCFGEDLAKELLKQAIYAAGTKVLNKYAPTTAVPGQYMPGAVAAPAYGTPAAYTSPVTTAPSAFVPSFMPTAAPAVTAAPAPAVTAAPTVFPGLTISH